MVLLLLRFMAGSCRGVGPGVNARGGDVRVLVPAGVETGWSGGGLPGTEVVTGLCPAPRQGPQAPAPRFVFYKSGLKGLRPFVGFRAKP